MTPRHRVSISSGTGNAIGQSRATPVPQDSGSDVRKATFSSRHAVASTEADEDKAARSRKQAAPRPAFSTYQQHFSPKKPQPGLGLRNAAQNEALADEAPSQSPDVARLQRELLRLQILYDESHEPLRRYEQSARDSLSRSFSQLRDEFQSIHRAELEHHRNRCYAVLREFLENDEELSGVERLDYLAKQVREFRALTSDDGPYPAIIRQFERWFEGMVMARRDHKAGQANESNELRFVEPVGADWSGEVGRLQHKLNSSVQAFTGLRRGRDDVGIAGVVRGHLCLAQSMQQELDACLAIEQLVLKEQALWMDDAIQATLHRARARPENELAAPRRGLWERS